MDLVQRKLTRDEWNSVEISIPEEEKKIIKMLINGFDNIDIEENYTLSLIQYLKIGYSENMENHLYKLYFQDIINSQVKKYNLDYENVITNNQSSIKKIDSMRLEKNTIKSIDNVKDNIFEFILLTISNKLLKSINNNSHRWNYYYYTLYKIINYKVIHTNKNIINYIRYLLDKYNNIDLISMIARSKDYIEKNDLIYELADIKLYEHQKKIFTIFKRSNLSNNKSRLVLYIAPTATGKTLTPLGLSQGYKIIFVCAARHVGISLAKSAISVGKKIALAFGCNGQEDIRLHLFSGSVLIKHEYKDAHTKKQRCLCGKRECKKIGEDIKYPDGTKKMDHSVGDKVEIMICDVQSYVYAMYYMCAFNNKNDIITYWDEPTITMDYDSHKCHETISKNWKENIIPNIVLSSATLPKQEEIGDVIGDFRSKFENANIYTVVSHDCKKSIPILNKSGYVELPHLLCKTYNELKDCINHCKSYLTVLRYFDLYEVSRFVVFIIENYDEYMIDERFKQNEYFNSLDDINMSQIKKN